MDILKQIAYISVDVFQRIRDQTFSLFDLSNPIEILRSIGRRTCICIICTYTCLVFSKTTLNRIGLKNLLSETQQDINNKREYPLRLCVVDAPINEEIDYYMGNNILMRLIKIFYRGFYRNHANKWTPTIIANYMSVCLTIYNILFNTENFEIIHYFLECFDFCASHIEHNTPMNYFVTTCRTSFTRITWNIICYNFGFPYALFMHSIFNLVCARFWNCVM